MLATLVVDNLLERYSIVVGLVPASIKTSLHPVTVTLYNTLSGVSACQLTVTGIDPTKTLASRKAKSSTVLEEKQWQT